jgi:histidinol-phosphate/aromatic aminotransferase/cobyric acid decarboxylase-like protein/N-acyl-L-homoserine lactone synthetase
MADIATTLTIATADDREQIYRIRHSVYATELAQHPENDAGRLTDRLDDVNTYVVARRHDRVVGFVAITPPTATGYSIDKYFARTDVPVTFDEGLFEVRLLTVVPDVRHTPIAALLMFAAFRYCESHGAHTIVAIGRVQLLDVYQRAGLRTLGRRVTSGAVTYELLAAGVGELRRAAEQARSVIRRIERDVTWALAGIDIGLDEACYHGGAFFDAIGDEFNDLTRAGSIINADVLDAWFPPAPSVVNALATQLPLALRTSPPTGGEGLRRVIARARGVHIDSVLPGAGSSDLIFAAFTTWMTRESHVLILDPMYGEYAHVLETVIGARVDRLPLSPDTHYDLDLEALRRALAHHYDWIVLVNPNSPTGRYVPGSELAQILADAPAATRIWIDETYVDFSDGESLERFAAHSDNVVVCKSMSKAYALSGVRAGYLCGPAALIRELRRRCPPWSVSLPAQIAACEALRATGYYAPRWRETHALREELAASLRELGWEVVPGCANFVLCRLPDGGPDADVITAAARERGLFVRPVASMGRTLGPRDLRIAVKDRITNQRMNGILRAVIDDLGTPTRDQQASVGIGSSFALCATEGRPTSMTNLDRPASARLD